MKADHLTQKHLIQHRGFSRTPYIGQHGELIAHGYELAAPQTLVRESRKWRDGA